MTIKYLYIMNIIFKNYYNNYEKIDIFKKLTDNNLENKLHVPIDSYILEAITLSKDEKSEYKSIKWSKLDDYNCYLEFQSKIRNRIKPNEPLDWECKTWITVSENRKQKNNEEENEKIKGYFNEINEYLDKLKNKSN